MIKEQFLTKEGAGVLQEKLHELKTVRRREIADAIHTAKEQGDLSENAEYVTAKEEQRKIEHEIAEIEQTLKNAKVIAKAPTDHVSIGNVVTLTCNGQERVYRIVGSNEANPLEGKISNESPIGHSLLGKQKGDKIIISTPAGDRECQVVRIS